MKLLRKFEEIAIHNMRENMLKKYRKTYMVLSVTWIAFWFDIARGKMKNYNKYYASTYTNPIRQIAFFLP